MAFEIDGVCSACSPVAHGDGLTIDLLTGELLLQSRTGDNIVLAIGDPGSPTLGQAKAAHDTANGFCLR